MRFSNHLRASGIDEVDIPDDHYWSIPEVTLYRTYERPTDFTIGALSEDLRQLRRIIDGTAPAIGFAFSWLAPILRYLGNRHVG
jgi:hypothetical protein